MIRSTNARTILDLCCPPVLDERPTPYHHRYDTDVLLIPESANYEMTQRAALARQWIADNAEACA